ncbi:TadE/TadG family type IV pilus assembly protein [Cupriavidus campinensis]
MRRKVGGASMVEFIIVLPVLLLLCLGIIQFGLLYQAKATLDYAALQAARAGALDHGRNATMRSGLARGLTPLFAHSPGLGGQQQALLYSNAELLKPGAYRIDVINPTSSALQDFGRAGEYAGATIREIPNDTLGFRSTAAGPGSGISVQDANLLKIRVTYCYAMYVPFANRTIFSLMNAIDDIYSTGKPGLGLPTRPNRCYALSTAEGSWRIPLESEAIVRMQTPYRGG